MPTPWSDPIVRVAFRDALPLLVPPIPFGLTLGVVMKTSALPLGVAWLSTPLVFAGAAQLAMVTLAATATWLTLVATCTVINARHVMYSAALAPRFADQPRWFRWLAPLFLVDQVFALTDAAPHAGDELRRYYRGLVLAFFPMWVTAVTAGIALGDLLPAAWRLDVAPAVMFCGMVVLAVRSRIGGPTPAAVAAIVAVGVTLLTLEAPNNLGLLIGALAGVVAGFAADRSPS